MSADRAKFKGMYNKYRNAKYPLFVEYFIEILVPAAELSLTFQQEKIDVVEAVHAVKKFFFTHEQAKRFSWSCLCYWLCE